MMAFSANKTICNGVTNTLVLFIILFIFSDLKYLVKCASVNDSLSDKYAEVELLGDSEETTGNSEHDSNDWMYKELVNLDDTENVNHHIIDLRKPKNEKIIDKTINHEIKLENITDSDKLEVDVVYRNPSNNDLQKVFTFIDVDRDSNNEIWTKYRWLMELFDHHKFDRRNLKNVSKECSEDMVLYLNALKQGEAWAAKMFDASGRYNGQFFFGNNYWLGSKGLCKELQYNITPPFVQGINQHLLRIPPFDTSFNVAVIRVNVGIYTPQVRTILLGVCLPKTCLSIDVISILNGDAREAEKLANIKIAVLHKQNGVKASQLAEDKINVSVIKVRRVPGLYDIWSDRKFHVFCGVLICTFSLISIATVYEMIVNYKKDQSILRKTKRINDDAENRIVNNNKVNISDMHKSKCGLEADGMNGNGAVDGKIDCLRNVDEQAVGHNEVVKNGHGNIKHYNVSEQNINIVTNGNGVNGSHHKNSMMECNRNGENGNGFTHDVNAKIREEAYGEGLLSRILLCFSALSNTGKIMNTDDKNGDAINCIHGLRFLSLGWVIMVHTYMSLFSVAGNKTLRVITERSFFYQTVGNASYSVDTFFFISGLLLTYIYQKILATKRKNMKKEYEKLRLEQQSSFGTITNGKQGDHLNEYGLLNKVTSLEDSAINSCYIQKKGQRFRIEKQTFLEEIIENVSELAVLLFNRFIRLTPPYLFAIGLNLLAMNYVYNNSVFEPVINEHSNCDKYWWRNILYVNNFYPGDEMCMKWSWYMANDTQFYIIGILLMTLSKKHPKISLASMGVLIVASWITTGYIAITNGYRAKIQAPFELFDKLYIKPWARLGPYLIGMLTGWYLWKWNGRIVLPTWALLLGWPSALSLMALMIYCMKDGYLDLWATAFYTSMGHTAWSLALAWVVVCCVAHRGGIISRILSYRGVFPLSRLAYCAYLVHVIIIIFTMYSSDGPIHLHNGIVLLMYAGLCVMSYLLSFVMSLCFEVPVVRLLKIKTRLSKMKDN